MIHAMITDYYGFLTLEFIDDSGVSKRPSEGDRADRAWGLVEVNDGDYEFKATTARYGWDHRWSLYSGKSYRVLRQDGDVLVEPRSSRTESLSLMDRVVFEQMWPEFSKLIEMPRAKRRKSFYAGSSTSS